MIILIIKFSFGLHNVCNLSDVIFNKFNGQDYIHIRKIETFR